MTDGIPHLILAYSNRHDCRRWGLPEQCCSPWNWASNWVLEMAEMTGRERVLDLGCRDNLYVLRHCETKAAELALLDIEAPPLGTTLPRNVSFVRHDLTRPLPFETGSFDHFRQTGSKRS